MPTESPKPFEADPQRAIRVGVGMSSPLWPAFAVMTGAGIAYWWLSQWNRQQVLLEGAFPPPLTAEPAAAPAEPKPEPEVLAAPEPVAATPEPEPAPEPELEAAPPEAVEPEPEWEPDTVMAEPPAVEEEPYALQAIVEPAFAPPAAANEAGPLEAVAEAAEAIADAVLPEPVEAAAPEPPVVDTAPPAPDPEPAAAVAKVEAKAKRAARRARRPDVGPAPGAPSRHGKPVE